MGLMIRSVSTECRLALQRVLMGFRSCRPLYTQVAVRVMWAEGVDKLHTSRGCTPLRPAPERAKTRFINHDLCAYLQITVIAMAPLEVALSVRLPVIKSISISQGGLALTLKECRSVHHLAAKHTHPRKGYQGIC
eukprot:1093680-Amphidinium_carterae.1